MKAREHQSRREELQCADASQAAIGKLLRAAYDRVLSEPLPGAISALLDRIERPPKGGTDHRARGSGAEQP
jgi:hypothetical protein